MTLTNVKGELKQILGHTEYRKQMLEGYRQMASRLGKAGAPRRAAHQMVCLLKERYLR